jgi:hypothetical protein
LNRDAPSPPARCHDSGPSPSGPAAATRPDDSDRRARAALNRTGPNPRSTPARLQAKREASEHSLRLAKREASEHSLRLRPSVRPHSGLRPSVRPHSGLRPSLTQASGQAASLRPQAKRTHSGLRPSVRPQSTHSGWLTAPAAQTRSRASQCAFHGGAPRPWRPQARAGGTPATRRVLSLQGVSDRRILLSALRVVVVSCHRADPRRSQRTERKTP